MDGSDDFSDPKFARAATWPFSDAFFPKQREPLPTQEQVNVVDTMGSDPASQSELDRRRKKMVAAITGRNVNEPILGIPGLLGFGG